MRRAALAVLPPTAPRARRSRRQRLRRGAGAERVARRLRAVRRRPRAARVPASVARLPAFLSLSPNPSAPLGEKPSIKSRLIGVKRVNNLIGVDYTIESQWLKLKGERGFMLIHGEECGLGQLLVPNRGHYPDGAPKDVSSE